MTLQVVHTLLVTDIDNTLALNGTIPDAHTEALLGLQRDGVDVVVATGRRYRSAAALLDRHGIDVPIIALNGAVGFDVDGTCFHHAALDPAQIRAVLEIVASFGANPVCCLDGDADDVWAPRPAPEWWEWGGAAGDTRVVDVYRHDWSAPASPRLLSVEVVAPDRPGADRLADEVRRTGVEVVVGGTDSGHRYLHVTRNGVDKSTAADAWVRRRGTAPGRTVAVGDGTNDVELLRWADIGVAIAGGEVNDHHDAHHVVPGPWSAGWAQLPGLLGLGR